RGVQFPDKPRGAAWLRGSFTERPCNLIRLMPAEAWLCICPVLSRPRGACHERHLDHRLARLYGRDLDRAIRHHSRSDQRLAGHTPKRLGVSAGAVLFGYVLFHQHLYADTCLQGCYFIALVYGWWSWTHPGTPRGTLPVTHLTG